MSIAMQPRVPGTGIGATDLQQPPGFPFTLDLTSKNLKLGTSINGEVGHLDFNLKMGAQLGGTISGHYLGELKNALSIPTTISHTAPKTKVCTILLVGAGGTGGYVIRDLARVLYALKVKGDTRTFNLKIIDGDKVETKNVLRQNFASGDVGLHKAEILARRYSGAFGIDIEAVPQMADTKLLADLLNGSDERIILGCVDNNEARRAMWAVCRSFPTYWVDSGNEKKSGQVVCGRSNYGRSSERLPLVTDLYPEISDPSKDSTKTEDSCAERAAVETQNIFVNMTAAGHVISYVRQIIMNEPITIGCIEFNIKGVTNVSYLTKEYLTKTKL